MACPHGLQCPRLKVRQGWQGGPRRCLALLLRWRWILLVSSFSECSINCLLGIRQVFIFFFWCLAGEDIVLVEVTGDPAAAF